MQKAAAPRVLRLLSVVIKRLQSSDGCLVWLYFKEYEEGKY